MVLYSIPGTCSLAPHICLIESELPYTIEPIDIKNKKTSQGDDFKKINPLGYVPALKHPDHPIITEVPTILQFISDQVPEKKILPPLGTPESYQALRWLNLINSEIHKGFSPLFDPQMSQETKERYKSKLLARLHWLHEELANRPYVLGSQWSAADSYLFAVLSWCKKVQINLGAFPAILNYLEHLHGRPSSQLALENEKNHLPNRRELIN